MTRITSLIFAVAMAWVALAAPAPDTPTVRVATVAPAEGLEELLPPPPAELARTAVAALETEPEAPLVSVPTTTSTTAPPTTTTSAPTTSTTAAPAPPAAGGDRLRSTSYCLTSNMASGRPTYVGAVASNRYKLGTIVTAWPNPWGDPNMRFTVEDRHKEADSRGYPTQFDFAMPRECDRAIRWGNQNFVNVRIVG